MIIRGFDYIASDNSVALVLGSMPGAESLRKQEYYGHSRNSFWRIMSGVLGFDCDAPYDERVESLRKSGIALWDVVHSCQRKGSLDSDIDKASIAVNDFVSFFRKHRKIKDVFFNGRTAEIFFFRYVKADLYESGFNPGYHLLPSTSPANASLCAEEKIRRWSILKLTMDN